MQNLLNSIRNFIAPFYDARGWFLILLCAAVELWRDPVLFWTMAGWLPLMGLIGGIAVMISRHLAPMISLKSCVDAAVNEKNTGAGLVVLGCLVLFSTLIYALTLLAKA